MPSDTAPSTTQPETLASTLEQSETLQSSKSPSELTKQPGTLAPTDDQSETPQPLTSSSELTTQPETLAPTADQSETLQPLTSSSELTAKPETLAPTADQSETLQPLTSSSELTAKPETLALPADQSERWESLTASLTFPLAERLPSPITQETLPPAIELPETVLLASRWYSFPAETPPLTPPPLEMLPLSAQLEDTFPPVPTPSILTSSPALPSASLQSEVTILEPTSPTVTTASSVQQIWPPETSSPEVSPSTETPPIAVPQTEQPSTPSTTLLTTTTATATPSTSTQIPLSKALYDSVEAALPQEMLPLTSLTTEELTTSLSPVSTSSASAPPQCKSASLLKPVSTTDHSALTAAGTQLSIASLPTESATTLSSGKTHSITTPCDPNVPITVSHSQPILPTTQAASLPPSTAPSSTTSSMPTPPPSPTTASLKVMKGEGFPAATTLRAVKPSLLITPPMISERSQTVSPPQSSSSPTLTPPSSPSPSSESTSATAVVHVAQQETPVKTKSVSTSTEPMKRSKASPSQTTAVGTRSSRKAKVVETRPSNTPSRKDVSTTTKGLPRRKSRRSTKPSSSIVSATQRTGSSHDAATSITHETMISTCTLGTATFSLDENKHRPFPPQGPRLLEVPQETMPRRSSLSQLFSFRRGSSSSQRKFEVEKPQKLRLILVGNNGVGKSTFLQTLVSGNFRPSNINTNIYAANIACTIIHKGRFIELDIQDTAGQERYRSLTASYYRYAQCCLIFFNVHERESFQDVENWLNDVSTYGCRDGGVAVVLVGTLHVPPKSRKKSDKDREKSDTPEGSGITPKLRRASTGSLPEKSESWEAENNYQTTESQKNNRMEVALQVNMPLQQQQHELQQHPPEHHHHHHHHYHHHHHHHHHHYHHHHHFGASERAPVKPTDSAKQREIPIEQAQHLADVWGIPYKEVDTENDYGSVLGAVHTLMDSVLAKAAKEARPSFTLIIPQPSADPLFSKGTIQNRSCCSRC